MRLWELAELQDELIIQPLISCRHEAGDKYMHQSLCLTNEPTFIRNYRNTEATVLKIWIQSPTVHILV